MPRKDENTPKARQGASNHSRARMAPALEEYVVGMALQGHTAPEILRTLHQPAIAREFRKQGLLIPKLRTVQRYVQGVRPAEGKQWRITDSAPEDARIVLELQVFLAEGPQLYQSMTQKEAEWLIRVSKIAPDLDPLSRWNLTRLYMLRAERDEPTADLDAWLGARPWAGEEQEQDYDRMVYHGRLPAPPAGLQRIDRLARLYAQPSVEHWNSWWNGPKWSEVEL